MGVSDMHLHLLCNLWPGTDKRKKSFQTIDRQNALDLKDKALAAKEKWKMLVVKAKQVSLCIC